MMERGGNTGALQMWMRPFLLLSGVAQIWWLENRLQRNISSSAPWINSLLPLQTLKREFSLFFLVFFFVCVCIVELKYLYSNKLELERPPRLITRSFKKKIPYVQFIHALLCWYFPNIFSKYVFQIPKWVPIRRSNGFNSQRFELWMDFAVFKAECVHVWRQCSWLPPGDLVNQRLDLRPTMLFFSASRRPFNRPPTACICHLLLLSDCHPTALISLCLSACSGSSTYQSASFMFSFLQ